MRTALVFGIAAAASIVVGACTTHNGGGGGGSTTAIVVGLSSEDMGATLGTIHVVTTVNGVVATDDAIDPVKTPKWYPKEFKITPPAGATTGTVEVKVDGFLEENAGSTQNPLAMIHRVATADFVPNQTLLLRVTLQSQCLLGLPGGGGPGVGGPVCSAPTTCISGSCQTTAAQLEPYTATWATDAPDICKPAGAGAPQVYVGTGQTDYLPLTDGQTLQAEMGPQGGHHIWIATRMHNLKQAGSTTTITATQPGTGIVVPSTAYVFTFDRDEGGFCKLFGLRFQLDANGADYKPLLGKPLDVTVTIKDPTGTIGIATAHVNINPTILCPGGQTTCQ